MREKNPFQRALAWTPLWLSAVAIVLLVGVPALPGRPPVPPPPDTSASAGWFSVQESRIMDPAGKEFVPVGINVNGPDWVWPQPTIGKASAMDAWHFNTIRLNACLPGGCGVMPDETVNNDLDGIVGEYTSKRNVVMIAQHNFGAGDGGWEEPASYARLEAWWVQTAARYKDNPYVWFNLLNEPITTLEPGDMGRWEDITSRLAKAVRSVAPRNVLAIDGYAFGQDKGDWSCDPSAPSGDPARPFDRSAFISLGPKLAQQFGPVVFDLHVYGQWGGDSTEGCTEGAWDATFRAYVNKIHAVGLALVVGETGAAPDKANEEAATAGSWNALHMLFRVAPSVSPKVGILLWHGSGGDSMNMFSPQAPWYNLPNDTLNWEGQSLLEYARRINP